MQKASASAQPQRISHRLGRSGRSKNMFAAIAALALLVPILVTTTTVNTPSQAASLSVLENEVPGTLIDRDTMSVELGAKFTSAEDGLITAIRFYKSAANTGPHVANLWSPSGRILATATLPATAGTAAGWQTVELPQPVAITRNHQYVASYVAPNGRYSADEHGLDKAISGGPLTILAGGGVYAYGNGGTYPTSNWKNSNYYVDVAFTPSTTTGPTAPPTATASPSPTVTAEPTPTQTVTPSPTVTPEPTPTPTTTPPTPPTGTLPAGVTVRGVDGGVGYYEKFNNPLPSSADNFPVGVWYESLLSAKDTELDKAAGLNTYVELTSNSNATLATQAGMNTITSWNAPGQSGTLLPDEVDMWAGPGSGAWTGNWPGQGDICMPANAQCGYTIQTAQKAAAVTGSMLYANYGKGVTFWESDAQAAKFVNDYPDLVSADNYWFTDPNICGVSEGGTLVSPQRELTQDECRKASNYGWTIDRVRSLVSPKASKPVWAFVEVGHPFSEDFAPTITGPQIKAAVWSSLIHGARGVVYFNHNFGGTCQSQHVLRDNCGAQVRPDVVALNAQIKSLAPVLNSPFLDGAAASTGSLDVSVKIYGGSLYAFAGSTRNGSQQVDITLQCSNATSATVLGENRTVPVKNGVINDTFADGNAVHLYQLNGSNACGLR
ncbi:hypothetical protein ART_4020 [Arthrobacter sp. PAMC 25486]|uniref:DUF4082 domain-containing protein n=1 Tax=Arthrobacter sp. PAMC 25486 TaxID=1494608 RepID=UPI0005361B47|nr:DUF4082 domain-containing protein [Arthrobacter sp. PAMC 25486]AIY03619.1 hypothetical protein ART_4020 [Arthrobacter sp. PAMC 25486]